MNTDVASAIADATAVGLRDVHLAHRTPYGVVHALRGVTFSVRAGSLTLLAGPNGAGKSSALSTIAGLQRAARGAVCLEGEWTDAGRAAAAARGRVGWLGSDPDDQLIALRVYDDIAFGLLNRGETSHGVASKVDAIAEQLAITALLTRTIDGLSQGERQRVALAGVLVLEPRVLLLDEPTLGLDRRAHQALRQLLSRYRARGLTMLIASHDEQLAAWADHVVLFEAGVVAAAGAPDHIVASESWRRVMGDEAL